MYADHVEQERCKELREEIAARMQKEQEQEIH
jgi:hypothetical protein